MTASPVPPPGQERWEAAHAPDPTSGTASEVVDADVEWHLAEAAKVIEGEPAPLRPDLLRIVLHGLAELCRLLYQRGHETPTPPPSLFRDSPVVAEALAMWEARVRQAVTEQRHAARRHDHGARHP